MKNKPVILIACSLLMLVSCGKKAEQTPPPNTSPDTTVQDTQTPQPSAPVTLANVQNVTASCNNQGEDSQHVVLSFSVDGPVESVQAEDFDVTFAGEELTADALSASTGENLVMLTININALKFGQLNLAYTGTDISPFTCEGIVAPGLKLSEAVQNPQTGTTEVQILNAWDVQGAAQLQLWENDKLVPTQGEESSEITAVHGHDFLNINCESAAANIASALSESYPDGYRFTSQGDTVIIEKLDTDNTVDVKLTVLEHLTISLG